jgi:hypothetical protein
MTDNLPTRRRDPDHLLRLHDELDELTSSGVGWRSASILAVVVATFALAVLRLGTAAGLGLEFVVVVLAAMGMLAGIGAAKIVRARSLRRAILRLEEESGGGEGGSG